jgi:hypothetical protein
MSNAEQNRQLLQRYTPEQCILTWLPSNVFTALQAGELITWRHYFPKGGRVFLYAANILFIGVLIALIGLNTAAENPVELSSVTLIALGAFGLLQAFNGLLFYAFFVIARTRARKLNAFWQGGKLLVSPRVEIGKPKDSDAHHGLRCTFQAPDCVLEAQKDIYKLLRERQKAQPIALMLYKSPQEYMIL